MNESLLNKQPKNEILNFKYKIEPEHKNNANQSENEDPIFNLEKSTSDMGMVEYYHSLTQKTFANLPEKYADERRKGVLSKNDIYVKLTFITTFCIDIYVLPIKICK